MTLIFRMKKKSSSLARPPFVAGILAFEVFKQSEAERSQYNTAQSIKDGFLAPRRRQMKRLDLTCSWFGTRALSYSFLA